MVRGLLLLAGLSVLGIAVVAGVLLYFNSSLPSFESLEDYHPPQVTRMYDRHGKVVAELFEEKRSLVALSKIPLHVRNAFLAAEDASFYSHPGLDFTGMLRALWRNVLAGRVVQGGSTITQQVIKTFILGPRRTYSRKIKELLLALHLESNLSKDDILSLYLNQIFFGHQCYGIQEAGRFFFGKDVSDLTIDEGAMLASLPKSPALYSPVKHPDRARKRRDWVLGQMEANGMISADKAENARRSPLKIEARSANFFGLAPYYAEHCRRILQEKLGRDRLYRGGLRVDLAVDLDLQAAARDALVDGLRMVDRRQGFRGALGRLSERDIASLHEQSGLNSTEFRRPRDGRVWTISLQDGGREDAVPRTGWRELVKDLRIVVPVVSIERAQGNHTVKLDLGSLTATLDPSSYKWARKFSPLRQTPAPKSATDVLAVGDLVEVQVEKTDPAGVIVLLSQPPLVQGSLVAIDPGSKQVLAMVGGSDFRRSPFIRAVQSRRQPGSSFKPILYAAAIHTRAYTPVTILMDTPETFRAAISGKAWKPRNFERQFIGRVTLRQALAHSINTVAVKVGTDIGPDAVIEMAHKLGIRSELMRNLSLALGTSEVTLLELTGAYAVFAAGGVAAEPIFITGMRDTQGQPVEPGGQDEPRQAISSAEAFVMTSLLRSVVEEGTGRRALSLGRPVAGKTGTTNQQRDGWFVGFSPELATGVWVGFDDHSRMGTGWAQGAGTALPIWVEFMSQALKDTPRRDFEAPADVVFARVDPQNGLLASPGLNDAKFEVFVEGSEPCSMSSRLSLTASEPMSAGAEMLDVSTGQRMPEGLFH